METELNKVMDNKISNIKRSIFSTYFLDESDRCSLHHLLAITQPWGSHFFIWFSSICTFEYWVRGQFSYVQGLVMSNGKMSSELRCISTLQWSVCSPSAPRWADLQCCLEKEKPTQWLFISPLRDEKSKVKYDCKISTFSLETFQVLPRAELLPAGACGIEPARSVLEVDTT